MGEKFRIKVNLITKEAEIDGSEDFVKTYYGKLQELMSEAPRKRPRKSETVEPAPEKKERQIIKKEPGAKRVTHISAVLEVIQASKKGASTAEIKEKTGLDEHQIWSIVDRAARDGKVKKVKRGLYVAIK